MSVDGIGKRGGITPGAPAPTAGAPTATSFSLAGADASASVAGSDAFTALERGEISVDQYLDARVESAVAPLVSRLSPEQLEFVRGELRSALENDPVLVELVQKTTSGVVRSE